MRYLACGVMAGLMLITVGCGGKPGAVPVDGTISYKGKPVANVVVTFAPKSPTGDYARGETDAAGKIVNVSTVSPGDGVRPGEYAVAISMAAKSYDAEADGIDYSVAPAPPFPVKYQDAAVSDLRVTVEKGQANRFTLELKD